MAELPELDGRNKEELEWELKQSAAAALGAAPEPGGMLDALLGLYAGMLDETRKRLNRAPLKHRLAFLNLWDLRRRAARPAETTVVFYPVDGCDRPVEVPAGTLVTGEAGDGRPVLFRTKWPLTVQPCAIREVCWCDRASDRFARLEPDGGQGVPPFTAWAGQEGQIERKAEFIFPNIFDSGEMTARLTARFTLEGAPLEPRLLADEGCFQWRVREWPHEPGGPAAEARALAVLSDSGELMLNVEGFGWQGDQASLCLELRDGALADLEIEELSLWAAREDIAPQAVLSDKRELPAGAFYPFGSPMESFGECAIFCAEALGRPGTEIELAFELDLEQSEELLPETPEEIDYKWIMRRPKPKPAPQVYEAFAQAVRWEYWNGAAYRELRLLEGPFPDFTQSGVGCRMRFVRPDDWEAEPYGAQEGYFIRLSCGGCDELFRLPRRVYTPRISRLRFSYRYPEAIPPLEARLDRLGEEHRLPWEAPLRPYCRPPEDHALYLALDGLVPGKTLELFCHMEQMGTGAGPQMFAHLPGNPPPVCADGTKGFDHSGLISLALPDVLEPFSLFGKRHVWLCLRLEGEARPISFAGLYPNAQRAANRVRHRRNYPLSALSADCSLALEQGNIIRIWLSIYRVGEDRWEEWRESPAGEEEPKEGFFILDYRRGILRLPLEVIPLGTGWEGDFIGVAYDTTDGGQGNLPAGAVTRLEEEIPFIAAVTNPLPTVNGWDSENDERMARRVEHRLNGGDRLVCPGDYERMAKDFCPDILDAKCIPGLPVEVVVLLPGDSRDAAFPELKRTLEWQMNRRGGAAVRVLPGRPVDVRCRASVRGKKLGPVRLDELKQKLHDYLDAERGGLSGRGWRLGELPSYEQIAAFLGAQARGMELVLLEVTALVGGREADWREMEFSARHVLGRVIIQMEVE